MLQEWSRKLSEKVEVIEGNVKQYIDVHPINNNSTINYTKDQIHNVQVFIENYQTYDGGDIR